MFESFNVIKGMVSVQRATIELWMHLGGLLSTQEAKVALGYRLVRLLHFFRALQPPACIHNSMVARCTGANHFLIRTLFHHLFSVYVIQSVIQWRIDPIVVIKRQINFGN